MTASLGSLRRVGGRAGLPAFALLLLAAATLVSEDDAIFVSFLITWITLIGLNIIFGYGGQMSLAHNAFLAAGAFTYGAIAMADVSPLIGVVAGVAMGGVIAALIALVAGRVRGLELAVLTLGIALATPELLSAMSVTGGFNGLVGIPLISVGDFELSGRSLYVGYTLVALAVFVLTRGWLRSSWGIALQAVAADPGAASSLGLSPLRYRLLAFVTGGALTGLAGALYASYQGYVGYLSFPLTIVLLWYVGVVLGGAGTIWGSLLGAIVITEVPDRLAFSTSVQPVLWGVLLILLVAIAPRGIAAAIASVGARRRGAEAMPPAPP
ncbi:MAG: branched-chain amino acid transporter permease, partial [Conexibacter sp.]|nr:branched-chain amino acid transporter permease [Conexibacter sp.]